jgi:hypothetical protein
MRWRRGRTRRPRWPADAGERAHPDLHRESDVAGLKKILLERKHLFARSLAEKLLTYAIGRRLEFYDLPAVDAIVAGAEGQGYKFHALITAVVQSDPFLMRRPVSTRKNCRRSSSRWRDCGRMSA